MDPSHVLLLALIQALTEFLPISSSGHLGLAGYLFGFDYQGVSFDLALHFGTLLAVLVYYREDLWAMARANLWQRADPGLAAQRRLGAGIALATIPALIVGAALGESAAAQLRTPWLIATNLILFGLLLGYADWRHRTRLSLYQVGYGAALLIGGAQAIALVPGISRSGITITMALLLGLGRTDAARYAFLLGVPVTLAACAHGGWSMWRHDEVFVARDFILGALMSALAGLACIHWLLGFLRRRGLMPFVVYRVVLGSALLVLLALRA